MYSATKICLFSQVIYHEQEQGRETSPAETGLLGTVAKGQEAR